LIFLRRDFKSHHLVSIFEFELTSYNSISDKALSVFVGNYRANRLNGNRLHEIFLINVKFTIFFRILFIIDLCYIFLFLLFSLCHLLFFLFGFGFGFCFVFLGFSTKCEDSSAFFLFDLIDRFLILVAKLLHLNL